MKILPCACCGFLTVESKCSYEICPVCFWEDDGTTFDTDYSASNYMTLEQAKANYSVFAAVEEKFSSKVRVPFPSEIPGQGELF